MIKIRNNPRGVSDTKLFLCDKSRREDEEEDEKEEEEEEEEAKEEEEEEEERCAVMRCHGFIFKKPAFTPTN